MEKTSSNTKKGFHSEPVYNEKHLQTKIKFYDAKMNTNFHSDWIPKKSSQWTFLSTILIDSVFRAGKNYYPQVFLECKYVVKKYTWVYYWWHFFWWF